MQGFVRQYWNLKIALWSLSGILAGALWVGLFDARLGQAPGAFYLSFAVFLVFLACFAGWASKAGGVIHSSVILGGLLYFFARGIPVFLVEMLSTAPDATGIFLLVLCLGGVGLFLLSYGTAARLANLTKSAVESGLLAH